jgi:folylpolyglutamate synthase
MELLEGLHGATKDKVSFDDVIFCPTIPMDSASNKGQFSRSKIPCSTKTDHMLSPDQINHSTDTSAIASLSHQNAFAARWKELDSETDNGLAAKVQVLNSVEEALEYVQSLSKDNGKVHALVTGSVHLVGRALGILEGADAL